MLESFLFVAFFLFLFQALSFWIRTSGEGVVCNSGGSFGIPVNSVFLSSVLVVVLGFFFFVWWKKREESTCFWWLLIFTAGASNMGERLFFGCVFDYIHLPLGLVGNAADIALAASVVFLLWREIQGEKMTS